MAVDAELKSLVALLDDMDETVVSAVNERMIDRGQSIILDLSLLLGKEKSRDVKYYIKDKIEYLSNEFTLNDLSLFLDYDYPDFKQGIYLISKLASPYLSKLEYDDLVYSLIGDMSHEITDDKTAIERVEIFTHIFYNRLKFSCKDYPVTKETTSVVMSVMNSKDGSPIAVSIIFFLLARTLGLSIHPLYFPGGFIPAYVENDQVLFYIDVFTKGEIFFENKLKYYLEVQGIDIEHQLLEVREDKTLLTIYLEYLQMMYSINSDTYNADLMGRALDIMGTERFLERADEGDE